MATDNPQRAALGSLLRDLRQRAGKHHAEVEEVMGWYDGKISRVEVGGRGIALAEADTLAELYSATAAERERLRQLAIAARKRSPRRVDHFAQSYIAFEQQAVEVAAFHDMLIYGLLQTEGYARALLSTGRDQIEERVRDRLARQRILTQPDAPRLRIVIGEGAIRQQVGGPTVMRQQIEHLLNVAEQLPTVSVRVVLFSAGAHHALGAGYNIVRVTDPADMTRVYIEGLTDAMYIHEPNDVEVYTRSFANLWDNVAADDKESAAVLRRHLN